MNKLNLQILPKSIFNNIHYKINSAGGESEAANAFLRAHGGAMDAAQFSFIVQGSINSYCIIGAVLFFLGGLCCLISIIFLEMQK